MDSDTAHSPAAVEPPAEPDAKPQGLLAWIRHAFAIEKFDESSLETEEKEVLQRLAGRIHAKGLTTAAILWIQSSRNMNFMASSALIAVEPVYQMVHPLLNGLLRHIGLNIPPEDYPLLFAALDKRYSLEYLVQQLEDRLAADQT